MMKLVLSLFVVGTLLGSTASLNSTRSAPEQSLAQVDRSPVIIELFTSEGCSSCPPADALLSKLEVDQPIAGAEVIGLEEHVDYWNHDGWTDPYSSGEWTFRQQEYVTRLKSNSPYTPQMIVDGQKEFSGSNVRKAQETIQEAARREKASVSIVAGAAVKNNVLACEIRVASIRGAGDEEKVDVWIAVTEAGLPAAVTAGENKGQTWEHASIVRSLEKIGSIPPEAHCHSWPNPRSKSGPTGRKKTFASSCSFRNERAGELLARLWQRSRRKTRAVVVFLRPFINQS